MRAPAGRGTRPTADRVREAVFSMLGDITAARVLDLFAGSGALGIEALSRGAQSATFVDTAEPALAVIRANLATVGADAEVVRRPALAHLDAARNAASQYDLVFLDPPYRLAAGLSDELTPALSTILAPQARVVAESDRRAPLELALALSKERRYGDTLIRIYDAR